MTGEVSKIQEKKRNPKLSYGFISAADKQYFFRLIDAPGIELGMKVSFEEDKNEKGLLATNIQAAT